MSKGTLIVIDGLDGTGKSTQLQLLSDLLTSKGIKHKTISFPDYGHQSSALIKLYLSGKLATNAEGVNAYAASSFYAVDRYASYKLFWESEYNDGGLIIAGRYVSSNAIHQMSKLPENEWDTYLKWLEEYEYDKLGLPKPDKTILLHMPIEVSQRLLEERYNGDTLSKDIHEADIKYLQSCERSASYAAKHLKWDVVECSDGTNPYPREEILARIVNALSIIN